MWIQKKSSSQQCLTVLVEKFKNKTKERQRGSFRAILTDFSKAFDCFLHGLLTAKLHGYGFDMASLKLIYTYPGGRKKRVGINNKYSSWEEILFGVPQG